MLSRRIPPYTTNSPDFVPSNCVARSGGSLAPAVRISSMLVSTTSSSLMLNEALMSFASGRWLGFAPPMKKRIFCHKQCTCPWKGNLLHKSHNEQSHIPVSGEFPAQRASNEDFFFVWWRHHGYVVRVVYLLCWLAGIGLVNTGNVGHIFREKFVIYFDSTQTLVTGLNTGGNHMYSMRASKSCHKTWCAKKLLNYRNHKPRADIPWRRHISWKHSVIWGMLFDWCNLCYER